MKKILEQKQEFRHNIWTSSINCHCCRVYGQVALIYTMPFGEFTNIDFEVDLRRVSYYFKQGSGEITEYGSLWIITNIIVIYI